MPLTSGDMYSTEKDGSINKDYCKWCYKDGEFVDKVSMEEYIEMCSKFGEQAGMTNEQMKEYCTKVFPTLKRWNKMAKIYASLNNDKLEINLEKNSTTSALVKLLPLDITINDLNKNEKYAYLDESLPTTTYSPKHIEAGDVMLFGDNCLVIFYESFDTSYSYSKIGHINNRLFDISFKHYSKLITKVVMDIFECYRDFVAVIFTQNGESAARKN